MGGQRLDSKKGTPLETSIKVTVPPIDYFESAIGKVSPRPFTQLRSINIMEQGVIARAQMAERMRAR